MKILKFTLPLLLLLMLKGCLLTTLHPLFTPEEYNNPEGLSGLWVAEDNDSYWNFYETGEDFYRLILTEIDSSYKQNPDGSETRSFSTDTSDLKAVFGVIEKEFYLDLQSVPNPSEEKGSFRNAQIAFTHTFYKFRLSGDVIEIYPADFKWIEDNLKTKKIKIKHERLENDNVILTASSKELQKFIKKYSKRGLFPKSVKLYRKKD